MSSWNHPLAKLLTFISAAAILLCGNSAQAQSKNRQIGTQFTVTADQIVARPHQKPCVVSLFTDLTFAHFSDTTQSFPFTPAAACPGPWKKVVLEVNFSENAGVQFDRTASIWLNNVNVYFGTTPEPLSSVTNTWHVERDVTDYSALFSGPQLGTIVLQNCTTDCPPPFQFLNGVFTVSADLEFYPEPGHSPTPRTPDVVLPLVQPNGNGGVNLPAFLFSPTDQLSTTLSLPTNIEGAYLDVVAQSQQADEQWYACFPNDLSAINDFYGCGNTDFRETEVTIDGTPAGITPISPWVFTGFVPDQWQPIPAAQTLDFIPYRVNLTPFASLLSDGNPHTVAISVFNNDFYFSTSSSLLLFLDHGSTNVTGAVVQNTLTPPSPTVTENLQGTSTVTGTIGVISNRKFIITGYVNTSHGQVATSISQEQEFSSTQTIDFDTVTFTPLDQKTSVNTSVESLTTVLSGDGIKVTRQNFSFPITVNVICPVCTPAANFFLTVDTTQNYQASKLVLEDGNVADFTSVNNAVHSSDATNPISSSQHYTSFSLKGEPYDCKIASTNNVLTAVSQGCNH